jgi:type III secretion system FlhB-like substrate exporter
MLKVGKTIPPDLFDLVASIYVEILKTSGKVGSKK